MLFIQKVNTVMTDFIIKKLTYNLSSHAGLALVGQYLKFIKFNSLLNSAFPILAGTANSDVLALPISSKSILCIPFHARETCY